MFEFAAIDSLEVGKNRMEALADVQETADLIAYCKIIRIESKFIRESGRSAQGVRLLNIEAGDRV